MLCTSSAELVHSHNGEICCMRTATSNACGGDRPSILTTTCFSAGIDNEFLFTGRLDNLGMSYCSLAALLDCYPTEGHLADESAIKAIALFDHEEVGSASAQGIVLCFDSSLQTCSLQAIHNTFWLISSRRYFCWTIVPTSVTFTQGLEGQ